MLLFNLVVLIGLCGPSAQKESSLHLLENKTQERHKPNKESNTGLENPKYLIENNGDYFEGDLNLSQEFIDAHYGKSPSIQSLTPTAIWPNREYHYICDESVDATTKALIREAIGIWSTAMGSCLSFIQGKSDLGYVTFTTNRHGCYSTAIGYKGAVEHLVSLQNPNCTNLHTVLHEIGHTLGFWHEQSRPDRDKYVRINFLNVIREYRKQFGKENSWGVSTNGMVYDYGSIMHYSQYAFSRNDEKTITILNQTEYQLQGSPGLGLGTTLSATDVAALKKHYMCT